MKRHTFPLAVTAVLSALVLSACGDDDPSSADDPATTAASDPSSSAPVETTTAASTTTSDLPEETSDGGSTETAPALAFFVGDTPQGARLYSEQREVEADNPFAEVLALVMAGDAIDPDYRTLVPADSLEAPASLDGIDADGFVGLTLTGGEWTARPAGMSKAEARLAVQQLAYSFQSLLIDAGVVDKAGVGGVDFYLDGEQASYLGVNGPVSAAPPLEVRALVNIGRPAEGATVSKKFTAVGEASSFEATVPWEIRDASGAVVQQGFSTATGWADNLYPWQSTIDVRDLDPGTYTFVALTDDPSDGEGSGPTEDSKTIVVE